MRMWLLPCPPKLLGPLLLLWLEWFSLRTKIIWCSKPFQQLPFSPRVKPVPVLWPASCHSGPHPLSIGLFKALPLSSSALPGLLAGPELPLPQPSALTECSLPHPLLVPPNTTFPVQLFLTPCLNCDSPASTMSYSLHHSPPPSLVLQIPTTSNCS